MGPEVELLEHHADGGAERAGAARGQPHGPSVRPRREAERLATHQHDAGARRLEQRHAAQQRTLARARRPDQARHLALGNVEVDAAQHLGVTEALDQGLDREGGQAHAPANRDRRTSTLRPSQPQPSTRPQ